MYFQNRVFHFLNTNVCFAFCLDTAVHRLQVYIRGAEDCPPRSLPQQLPTPPPARHPGDLPGLPGRLPHSQPHVHDGAQVSNTLSTCCFKKQGIDLVFKI